MSGAARTVTSADGTSIAYRRSGSGPSLILLGGSLDDGAENAVLVPELDGEFTVYNFARRGRGASGDPGRYTVRREIEDLAAMLEAAGGSAHLFGASSGGALALEAAAAGLPIDRLVVYDVPYSVGHDAMERWRIYRAELAAALAHGRTDEALAAFMRLSGVNDDDLAGVRGTPFWNQSVALAPTLAYDAAVLGDGRPPADRLALVRQETLLLTRSTSDPYLPALPVGFFEAAAAEVALSLGRVSRLVIDAPGHAVDADALAPPLRSFLAR